MYGVLSFALVAVAEKLGNVLQVSFVSMFLIIFDEMGALPAYLKLLMN